VKLVYDIQDMPKPKQIFVFACQQLLAILAATIAVPAIIGNGMTSSAALFGAGAGTLVYQFFTMRRSPIFLGSSFAFIGSMFAAFAGGVSMQLGYAGLIIGACIAALVYIIIALVVKVIGTDWIDRFMPAAVIGPTVSIIGLSLAGNAISDLLKADAGGSSYVAMLCGLITLFSVIAASVYGTSAMKLIPFIIGIGIGYVVSLILTLTGIPALQIMDFSIFHGIKIFGFPEFTFLTAAKGISEVTPSYIATIFVAYAPVAFVVFAEHLADHKNLSTVIGTDLIKDPGLHRTLLGDGVGSAVGALFGGCPNTTYGESLACVALTGNASVVTITATAVLAIVISFIGPIVVLLDSIPSCVMGGCCIALYGFIAVSGLKMIQKVDLEDNRNVFTVSTVLIAGIGGLTLSFGKITLTSVACALILGIISNLVVSKRK